MKYIVYITTNTINHKIYIGVHQTETPYKFDGYLGCGAIINKPSSYNKDKTHLHNAILKYGTKAFTRKTLKVFDTLEDALDLEALLVNEEFIKRKDTYNMTNGGNLPPKLTKPIYQFTLDGKLLKTWDSIIKIIDTEKVNHDRIYMCIKGKYSFNNCFWSYENSIDISEYRLSARGYVYQYNMDGVLLNKFKNASEAALQLDVTREAIVNAVYNRTRCCGYYFLKADEDINTLFAEKTNIIKRNTTPVYRYLLDGTFDKEFSSIKMALIDTPKTSHGNIIRAIKNNKTCGGYKWSYVKSNTYTPFMEIKSPREKVKIAQYDLQHNLIKVWDSVKDCKKQYPSCQRVCRKDRRSSKGYIFEYIK